VDAKRDFKRRRKTFPKSKKSLWP